MTLVLTIENEQSLPNGAPVSVRLTGTRGIDIGRSSTIDWPLPDSTRFISGRHCEVRYRDDGYWLNDVSTNGTFLNDSARRIQGSYKLRHGDRLAIGSYVIAVAIEPDEEDDATPSEAAAADALAPIDGRDAARLDVEIAQAIAVETAPADAGRSTVGGSTAGLAADDDGATARPHTVVRVRGFSAAAAAPEPAADVACAPSPREEEARAWSAPPAADFSSESATERRVAEASGPAGGPDVQEFLRRFARGAGIPEQVLARQDGLKVAEELGALMRLTVEDLTQLLSARFKAKRFARTASQTMIQALDNNPLKFAPTPSDALKIMFGPRTSGYLDARRAFAGAFTDLKTHQVATFAAMQQAVRMLVEDLDPKAIEDAAGADSGLAALFGGRKGRLWDLYTARWQAKTLRHEDGLVDAFMLYFAQCYDQGKEANKEESKEAK
jgi:type VI secretion system protein ImpI